MDKKNEEKEVDLEVFTRMVNEHYKSELVKNSVKDKSKGIKTTITIEETPQKPNVRKEKVGKPKLQKARLALACVGFAYIATVVVSAGMKIGMKIDDYRTYLSAKDAIVNELEQDIGGILPETKEKREAIYRAIATDFDLNLSNKNDQEFLAYLMVMGSSDKEARNENFTQILEDYGYSTQQSFYLGRGYLQFGEDGSSYPSGDVYANYMESRFDGLVESVQNNEEGVKKH